MTSDLYPTKGFLVSYSQKKSVLSNPEVRKLSGRWRQSYCYCGALTSGFTLEKTPSSVPENYELTQYSIDSFWDCIPNNIHNTESHYKVAQDISIYYYHNVDLETSRNVLIPLWVYYYQVHLITSGVSWVQCMGFIRAQTTFGLGPTNRTEKIGTIDDAIKEFNSVRPNFIGMANGIYPGCIYHVDMNNLQCDHHPLSLNGIVTIQSNKDLPVDTTITVVAYYYDLSILVRSSFTYRESFVKFASIRHPIVFYGSIEDCDIITKYRKEVGLEEWTLTIVRNIYDWEPVQKHRVDFETSNHSDLEPKNIPKFTMTVCLKPYHVMDAIERSPFGSSKYAYIDSGVFKWGHFETPYLLDVPLFSNIKLGDKVVIPSASASPGSTEEEMLGGYDAHHYSWFMIGNVNAWYRFFQVYRDFIEARWKQHIFRTEQIFLTRIQAIHQNIVDPRLTGFEQNQILDLLNIKRSVYNDKED